MEETQAGFKYLKTYQLSAVSYDLTVEFCNLFVDKRSRTYDQMVQAGRSGKQNIAEGYEEESLKSYIKLLGVAKASIIELIEDYEDFLRQRGLAIWPANHPKVREFRGFRVGWVKNPQSPQTPQLKKPPLPKDPEEAANLMLTLCHLLAFLLDRQIERLKEKFVEEGGWTEKLFRKRLERKDPT